MKIKVKLGSGESEAFAKFLKNSGYDFEILESPEIKAEGEEIPQVPFDNSIIAE